MSIAVHSLFSRAAEGDATALRTLLKRHGPQARRAIHGKIARKWRSLLDEDDVMQVTYLEAFLHIDQLEAEDEPSFIAWLARIAENALRDAIRGLQRQKRPQPANCVDTPAGHDSYFVLIDQLVDSTTTPSHHAARNEFNGILDEAIDRLPPDYRRVVRLCDLGGRSVVEVAGSMGKSVGAVHMVRARAHDRLRTLLGSKSQFFSDLV